MKPITSWVFESLPLIEPNHALHGFTAAPKLQFHISDPRSKIVQNVNFSPVSQNSNSSLKLNSTHYHEFRGMLGFQNRVMNIKLLTQTETIMFTSKNAIFTESSFANSETTIGFMTLKQVWEWSQILILSPGWPCTQNEINFNCQFHSLSQKNVIFLQITSNISKLYTVEMYFLSRVWIQNRHLKIRFCLARIHL